MFRTIIQTEMTRQGIKPLHVAKEAGIPPNNLYTFLDGARTLGLAPLQRVMEVLHIVPTTGMELLRSTWCTLNRKVQKANAGITDPEAQLGLDDFDRIVRAVRLVSANERTAINSVRKFLTDKDKEATMFIKQRQAEPDADGKGKAKR